MKLHLPILLRRAVLAVMAVLATSPAIAANTHVYADTADKITGDSEGNARLDSDYSSSGQYYDRVQTKPGGWFGIGAEYEYHHHGNLEMTGSVTNRIETGLFNNGILSPSANITVNTEYDVKMLTDSGVNIIAGNAAELEDTLTVLIENNKDALGSLQQYSDSIADLLLPTETKAPTVKAGRDVLMNGPGNAVMLGSNVTGNTITMTNNGTSITSAAAIVGGLLEGIHDYNVVITSIDIKEKLDSTLQTYLAPLQGIQGNFNIVQGSTIGNTNTVNVTMHADVAGKTIPTGTSALGANIVLGGSTITAQNVDLTGMASVVSNIPFNDAFDKLANSSSSSGVGIELVKELLGTGKATKLEATAGDLDLGSEFNVVLGGGAAATEGVSLTANAGAVNMTGALNVVGGNTTIKAKDINLVPSQTTTINALANDLKSFIDISSITGGTLSGLADQEISASIVAGGTNMEATNNIKTDGTLGLVLNTPVSDVMSSLVEYMNSTNQDETWMIYNMLQPGTATTITSANGSIELGSQLNLVHGGGFTETAGANALKISAANGTVNIQGTANVVSGNVEVKANEIKLTGERLPSDLAGAAGSVVDRVAEMLPDGAKDLAGGMLDKLVQKGNVNLVTGGATLEAGTGGITMSDIPVDAVGATGAINAVLDTELVGLVEGFMERDTESLIKGGSHQTTLKSDGDINMLGRVNVVNGGKVVLDAEGDVNLQGSASLISGGAKVDASNININTDEAKKYKMYFDSTELGGLVPADSPMAPIVSSISNMGVNAGIVTGGAELTADQNITMGGTLGLVMNTPLSDVMTEFMDYLDHQQETWMVYQLLQKGTATTVTSTNGNIELGAQFNLAHGGNFAADGSTALKLSAANGAVNINGTLNVVSGNTTVDAKTINMTGERLPQDMAGVANDVIGSIAGDLVGNNSGISGMLNKLVTKGNANMVVGGATLTASQGITMNGVANAVFDTEIVDLVEAFMERNTGSLEEGSNKLTTLHTTTGNIDLLGRLNMVNGSYVLLQADAGDVNLQGNMSLIGGGAKVNATNININTDESSKYKMYLDSDELGAIIPAGSPFAQLIPGSISNVGVNAGIVAGGAALTAKDNIKIGGTLGLVMNTPMSDVMTEFTSYMDHQQETWMVYQLLQKGTATTVTSTNGDIELGAQFNLAHGGGFTATAGENALVISAANGAVNINGTLNVVSGNTLVDAQNINMTGERLPQDMADVANDVIGSMAGDLVGNNSGISGMLNKLVTKGNANMVVGGATLTASKGITMNGVANAVFDTEIVDLVEAFMERNTGSLEEGSNKLTTLHTTTGNIDLLGRLNMVNGGYVLLQADAGDVNLQGNMSMVSGGAKVNATNININTDESNKYKMYIDSDELGAIIPAESPYTQLITQMGITDKLGHAGVNGSLIAGGATLTATNNITTGGTVGLVLNTPMDEIGDRLMSLLTDPNHDDEIWMAYELLQKGTATTLNADNNIELGARMNVLHGGNMANANAALALTAGNTVKLDGTLNLVSGNVTVNAKDIELKGGQNVSLNLAPLVDKVMGSSEYAELISGSGMLDKIATKGVNGNMVTGGATLTAQNNIKLDGMANFVLDTELTDVVEAVMERKPDAMVQGGSHKTTLTATNGNIDLLGRLNVVNGGQVELKAGQTVRLEGTANLISGNAKVSGKDIEMTGKNNVGLNWGELIPDKYAGYGELADKMGILDKVNSGVNGNVVAGGAKLTAENDISINGMAGAVVDTTLGSVVEAMQTMNGTPLLEGKTAETTLKAGGDINLNTRLNVVNGGKTLLDAGEDVNMGGTFNVVATNANVNAGGNINMNAKNKVGVDISPMLNGHYAELAEEMGMTEVLKDGVSSNIVAGGANLKAKGDVVMSGVATAIVDTTINNVIGAAKGNDLGSLMQGGRNTTTVTAENDIKLESQMNVVNGGNSTNAGGVVLNAGNDVIMGGDINVVNRAKVNAGNNVDFGGNLNVLKNATVAAQNGAVSFNNTRAEMTNGSISAGAGIFVNNSELVNTVSSDVSIDSVVNITNSATLANLGSLSLNDAIVVDSTVYIDSANTVVSGALTMQSATLVFTSDTLTLNDTGIDLSYAGDALNVKDVPTVFNDSAVADAVAGVNFIISSDLLDDSMGGDFELILFENATQNDYDKMLAAIQVDEISITLSDLNRDALLSDDIAVEYVNNNIVIKGSAFIPEPSTATLSLLALAALAARRRRASR